MKTSSMIVTNNFHPKIMLQNINNLSIESIVLFELVIHNTEEHFISWF